MMTSYETEEETEDAPLLEVVKAFFEQDQWMYTQMQGRTILRVGFQGKNGRWDCLARTRERLEQIVFYSIAPVKAPEDVRPEIAEYLTRANYNLIIGNFEIDLDDGEIRCKTSLDIEGGELRPKMVENLIYANVTQMDRYFKGVLMIIYGDASATQAMIEVEKEG
jgi:hypothetical protein